MCSNTASDADSISGCLEKVPAKKTINLEFTPDQIGKFEFRCSIVCGSGHEDMLGELVVEEAPQQKINVTFDEKGNANINLNANALLGGKDDGSFAWISYGATRSTWRKEQFAKRFPQEPVYRHSLAEELDALRSVITLATVDNKVKNLSPSLAKLKKLNDEGLLEAYILLAHADEGISKDHPAYLQANREKLRRYMIEYVVTGGGN